MDRVRDDGVREDGLMWEKGEGKERGRECASLDNCSRAVPL